MKLHQKTVEKTAAAVVAEIVNAAAADREKLTATARDLTDKADRLTAAAKRARAAADRAKRKHDPDAADLAALALDVEHKATTAADRAADARAVADLTAADAARLLSNDRAAVVVTLRQTTPAERRAADLTARVTALVKDETTPAADLDAARADLAAARADADRAAKDADATAPVVRFRVAPRINPDDPASALAFGHKVAAAVAARLDLTAPRVTIDPAADLDAAPLAAARAAAAVVARRAVVKQGTPTQWAIFYDARARRWDAPDLADLTAAALDAVAVYCAAPAALAVAADRADRLAVVASKLAAADRLAVNRDAVKASILHNAADDLRDDLTADARRLTARAVAARLAVDAARARVDDPDAAAALFARAGLIPDRYAVNQRRRDRARRLSGRSRRPSCGRRPRRRRSDRRRPDDRRRRSDRRRPRRRRPCMDDDRADLAAVDRPRRCRARQNGRRPRRRRPSSQSR